MAEKTTLLVWQNIPDSTQCFVLTGKWAERAKKCAGVYINGEALKDDHVIFQLDKALGKKKVEGIKELPANKACEGPFSSVVVCGFYC